MPSSASGTFTRKTEPHQKWSSSQPPMIGPSGMPPATEAVITPIAFVRSFSSSKREGMTDSDSGMTRAAPSPMRVRAAMIHPGSSARAPSSEPVRKTTSPATSIRRRPNRSPARPAGSIVAANTTM